MNPYLFVLATLLAIVPILVIFKVSMERIKENPRSASKSQVQFMIGVALSDMIPIIIIIYAFMNIATVQDITELYSPGIIIILSVIIALFFIFLQRIVDVEKEAKNIVDSFTLISMALVVSIPIISIIGLVSMIP